VEKIFQNKRWGIDQKNQRRTLFHQQENRYLCHKKDTFCKSIPVVRANKRSGIDRKPRFCPLWKVFCACLEVAGMINKIENLIADPLLAKKY
jgi:hypothetical protein